MIPPASSALHLTRRALALVAWVALAAPLSVGLISPSAVWADDEDGSDDDGRRGRGRGRGGDSDDDGSGDDDDNDGGGQGRGRGGDSDEPDNDNSGRGGDDESDDDDGGSGGGDEGSDNGGGSGAGGGSDDQGGGQTSRDGARQSARAPRDIAVYYSDGWVERIVDGRYELMDDMSRLVVRRTATGEDFSRMEALR